MKDFSDYNITIPLDAPNEARVVCPECSPHRSKQAERCLAVNVEKKTWLCHHCGWTGGISGDKPFYQPVKPAPKVYIKPKFREEDLPAKVISWFADRGISEYMLHENRISAGQFYMPGAGEKVNCIHFPYFEKGEVVNIKHRDGKKNFCMEKGAERVLYGLDDINDFCTVIVEGEIDKLSCCEVGYGACVSVPDGAPSAGTKNYSTKFSFLESAEEKIKNVHKWIIAVDNDEPGVRLKEELIRRLGSAKCWVASWPDGCKDANDVLVKHGQDGLKDCLENAVPVPVSGLFSVNDFSDNLMDTYHHGFKGGEKTGWPCVDKLYSVRQGEWSLVTGIPGSGKSEWLDALMVNLANESGWVFGVLSMENLPLERHFAKLAEKYIGLPFADTMKYGKMSGGDIEKAKKWGADHFHFMIPDDEDLTVDGVLKLAKVLCYRYGINGLVIDPWNELTHARAGNISETEHISGALSRIRKFARENNIHIWVVAHPTKLQKDKDGKYPPPTPYDVSGSAHWRNKADNAITVHRGNITDHKDKTVEIHVQKIRFKEIGRVGLTKLTYDMVSGRYYDETN